MLPLTKARNRLPPLGELAKPEALTERVDFYFHSVHRIFLVLQNLFSII